MNKLIELTGVGAGYDGAVALKDINLTVRAEDFIGVIGPNGGGKTTLLKVILGEIKPFAGTVKYYFHTSGTVNSNIGYMPQKTETDDRFPISVMEVALSGLMGRSGLVRRFGKGDRERVEELLERTGVAALRKRAVGDLSGGEKQRVFLSRALVSDPKLLILDEPGSFVDNQFEHDLYEILKELNKKMAVIMVSHDIGTISAYVKTIACVNRNLHYHESNIITEKQLAAYDCPVQIIAHGRVPHTVLKEHKNQPS